MTALTAAQERMLAEIRAAGIKVYNGRARRSVEALAAAGLVVYEYDSVAQTKGSGFQYVERFICAPAPDEDEEDEDFAPDGFDGSPHSSTIPHPSA